TATRIVRDRAYTRDKGLTSQSREAKGFHPRGWPSRSSRLWVISVHIHPSTPKEASEPPFPCADSAGGKCRSQPSGSPGLGFQSEPHATWSPSGVKGGVLVNAFDSVGLRESHGCLTALCAVKQKLDFET